MPQLPIWHSDTTTCRWALGSGELRPEATFEGHTDWVNDVTLVGSNVLASASADHAVRLWKPNSLGEVRSNRSH
jgi:WD40 repeat protein